MPTEFSSTIVVHDDQQQLDVQPVQTKQHCTLCHIQLDAAHFCFSPTGSESSLCAVCHGVVDCTRPSLIDAKPSSETEHPYTPVSEHLQHTRRGPTGLSDDFESSIDIHTTSENDRLFHLTPPPPTTLTKPAPHVISTNLPLHPQSPSHTPTLNHPFSTRRNTMRESSASPLTDITRLRVRPQAYHCLYPGASFRGTQKSGKSSYDVNVTIVDVNFTTSFLCGYLCIRDLTEDYPELTTYFDAEIIGSRYGFLTQDWGANEKDDIAHWSRFPAFRHARNECQRPLLTMSDRDRGAVFMRWKERFLVPDHRVRDINGASFAGFYYVCVDFNPSQTTSSVPSQILENVETRGADTSLSTSTHKLDQSPIRRARRDSSVRRGGRSPSQAPRSGTPVATMTGYYFHQYSEPYQELSLCHVPERTSSISEFR